MTADMQQSLYRAARADDRAEVARLLKELVFKSDRDEDIKQGLALTIDMATENMATFSLTVLCFQSGATGLFDYLAEKDPAEVRRIAPKLVGAFDAVSFARPIAALGADKSFMEGGLLSAAVSQGDIETVKWMIDQGVDVNVRGASDDGAMLPFSAADKIEDPALRDEMKTHLFKAGFATAKDDVRAAYESYEAARQERSAANALSRLKSRARGPGLRL